MTIVTRFAPSPTGYLHIGGARTALFSWLFARKLGGKFVLRIEDTDRERSTQASIDAILESMAWLGLDYNIGPILQTTRFDRYRELIQQLLDKGLAYYCYCSKETLAGMRAEQMQLKQKPRYDGRCRQQTLKQTSGNPVVRFKNPADGEVVVNDMVRGKVVFNNQELDDLIIARSDGTPTYNFTVVVDDLDMQISHVIRGDDHLNNTPRQINLIKALQGECPKYAHVPMILGEDGQRLSKRHGAVSVLQYRDEGYLPESLLNYLVRLGWSHGDQEIFSIDELIEYFDIDQVNRSASTFNADKLLWLNHHYLMHNDADQVAGHLAPIMQSSDIDASAQPALADIVVAQRERCKTLVEMAQRSIFFYQEFGEYDEKAAKKNLRLSVLEALSDLREALSQLPEWGKTPIHETIVKVAEQHQMKMGKLAQPLRVAVTGGAVSPPIDITLELIGKDKTLLRIDRALDDIRTNAQNN